MENSHDNARPDGAENEHVTSGEKGNAALGGDESGAKENTTIDPTIIAPSGGIENPVVGKSDESASSPFSEKVDPSDAQAWMIGLAPYEINKAAEHMAATRGGDKEDFGWEKLSRIEIAAGQGGGIGGMPIADTSGGSGNDGEEPVVRGRLLMFYTYRDGDGLPHSRIYKYEALTGERSKTFRMYHWLTTGSAGWYKGRHPSGLIPYNLPGLMVAAKDKYVFITEGEKDADTLCALGLVASTNAAGAGKWTDELSNFFISFSRIVVVEDNDEIGQHHARRVAKSLMRIVPNVEVRIVRFTDLPPKGDVTDWVGRFRRNGATDESIRDQLLARVATTPVFQGLRRVRLIAGDMAGNVNAIEKALMQAGVPLFVRIDRLVEPVWADRTSHGGHKTRVALLREVSPNSLAVILTKRAAICEVYDKRSQNWVKHDPPERLMSAITGRGFWPFPPIAGIINVPTLTPTGALILEKGLNQETGLWYEPDPRFVLGEIPDRPSKKQAQAALETIKSLLVGFPFVGDVDLAVAVAGMMTVVLRGAMEVAPAFLYRAPKRGTGKTHLLDSTAMIGTGSRPAIITYSGSEEENEKRLGAMLREGSAIIALDNCTVDLHGKLLCQMTSHENVAVRILGLSETKDCLFRGTVLANGNNVKWVGDMTRRGLTCNLDALVERPETRAFDFDPIDWIRKDRGKYVAAVMTIARGYMVQGERVSCSPLGNYAEWCKFVREPLIWLGMQDPALSIAEAQQDDPDMVVGYGLVDLLKEHIGVGVDWKVRKLVELANTGEYAEFSYTYDAAKTALFEFLVEHAPSRTGRAIDNRAVGKILARIKDQVFGNYRVREMKSDDKHGTVWRLVCVDEMGEVKAE